MTELTNIISKIAGVAGVAVMTAGSASADDCVNNNTASPKVIHTDPLNEIRQTSATSYRNGGLKVVFGGEADQFNPNMGLSVMFNPSAVIRSNDSAPPRHGDAIVYSMPGAKMNEHYTIALPDLPDMCLKTVAAPIFEDRTDNHWFDIEAKNKNGASINVFMDPMDGRQFLIFNHAAIGEPIKFYLDAPEESGLPYHHSFDPEAAQQLAMNGN